MYVSDRISFFDEYYFGTRIFSRYIFTIFKSEILVFSENWIFLLRITTYERKTSILEFWIYEFDYDLWLSKKLESFLRIFDHRSRFIISNFGILLVFELEMSRIVSIND